MSLLGGQDPPGPWLAQGSAGGRESRAYLRTVWRTMFTVDAEAWKVISENAPFRFTRWCAILGLVTWRWAAGAPQNAAGWWPVLFLAIVLLLPDTAAITLGGTGVELRRAAKDIENWKDSVGAGEAIGAAAAAAAVAQEASEPPVTLEAAAAELEG